MSSKIPIVSTTTINRNSLINGGDVTFNSVSASIPRFDRLMLSSLKIEKGGTNSAIPLTNGRIMVSNSGSIIEGPNSSCPEFKCMTLLDLPESDETDSILYVTSSGEVKKGLNCDELVSDRKNIEGAMMTFDGEKVGQSSLVRTNLDDNTIQLGNSETIVKIDGTFVVSHTESITNLDVSGTLTASIAEINNLSATTANIGTATINSADLGSISADTGNIETMTIGSMYSTSITTTSFTSTTANIGSLTSSNATISTLNSGTSSIANLSATTSSLGSASANSLHVVGVITSDSLGAVDLLITGTTSLKDTSVEDLTASGSGSFNSISAGSVTSTSSNLGNATASTLTVTGNSTLNNFTASSAVLTSINTVEAKIGSAQCTSLTVAGNSLLNYVLSSHMDVGSITSTSSSLGTATASALTVTGNSTLNNFTASALTVTGNSTLNNFTASSASIGSVTSTTSNLGSASATSLSLTGLSSSTTSNMVYINGTTGVLSYGAVPIPSIVSGEDFVMTTNGSNFKRSAVLSTTSSGANLTGDFGVTGKITASDVVDANNGLAVTNGLVSDNIACDDINTLSSLGAFTTNIGNGNTGSTLIVNSSSSVNGLLTALSDVKLSGISSVQKSNVVYFDTTTKLLSYGTVSSTITINAGEDFVATTDGTNVKKSAVLKTTALGADVTGALTVSNGVSITAGGLTSKTSTDLYGVTKTYNSGTNALQNTLDDGTGKSTFNGLITAFSGVKQGNYIEMRNSANFTISNGSAITPLLWDTPIASNNITYNNDGTFTLGIAGYYGINFNICSTAIVTTSEFSLFCFNSNDGNTIYHGRQDYSVSKHFSFNSRIRCPTANCILTPSAFNSTLLNINTNGDVTLNEINIVLLSAL